SRVSSSKSWLERDLKSYRPTGSTIAQPLHYVYPLTGSIYLKDTRRAFGVLPGRIRSQPISVPIRRNWKRLRFRISNFNDFITTTAPYQGYFREYGRYKFCPGSAKNEHRRIDRIGPRLAGGLCRY